MRRFLRDNGLGVTFGLLFVGALVAQAVAGHADFNNRQLVEGGEQVTFWQFVASSDFAVDVAENWQSEYLQFFLFIYATVWLVQRGSPESKPTVSVPKTNTSATRVGRPSRPATASVTIAPMITARPVSTTTSSGSRRTRSAHTPTSSANSRNGSHSAVLTRPTCAGVRVQHQHRGQRQADQGDL